MVAHRGASAQQPENTLAAFQAAVEAGADIVEFDVRRSPDGALVISHDPVERARPRLPTLDEALELLRGRVALEVEIKNVPGEADYEPSGAAIARDVVAALRRHAFADAFIASFDAECLRSVEELDSGIPTGLLVEPTDDLEDALERAAGRHAFLLPAASALESADETFVDRAHERAICICTWTVDDPAAMEQLFELGADAVETNDPALGVRVRDALAQG